MNPKFIGIKETQFKVGQRVRWTRNPNQIGVITRVRPYNTKDDQYLIKVENDERKYPFPVRHAGMELELVIEGNDILKGMLDV